MENFRPKILIIEDAPGVARLYEQILGDKYETTICYSGKGTKKNIEKNQRYDLVILDVVLPAEDDNYALENCSLTGFRLCEMMLKWKTTSCFYVITVKSEMKEEFEELCKKHNAILKFESKIDHQPEEFITNVNELLSKS